MHHAPHTKFPCPHCSIIGEELYLDFIEEDETPNGIYELAIVPGTDDTVRQCLDCGRFYKYESKYDSDIFQPTDSLDIRHISPDTVNSIRESEEKIRKYRHRSLLEFKRKVKKQFSKEINSLSIIEKFVFESLMEKDYSGIYFTSFAKELNYSEANLSKILDKLNKKHMVTSNDRNMIRINYK